MTLHTEEDYADDDGDTCPSTLGEEWIDQYMEELDDGVLIRYVVRVVPELDFLDGKHFYVGPFDTLAEAESYADGLLPHPEGRETGAVICELHSLSQVHCEDQEDAHRRRLIGEISHEMATEAQERIRGMTHAQLETLLAALRVEES